ncbi:MAG: SRPBCC family protein [Rubrobacteraceae bacterium]
MKLGAILIGGVILVGGALFAGSRAGAFEREIATGVEIEGSPDQVWKELADFESYDEWNPFIPSAKGRISEGEKLEVRIAPPGSGGMTFKPEALVAEPDRELRWLGRLLLPGVFDGEHYFLMESAGSGRTRFVQGEKFNGLLVPFLWKSLDADTRHGFEEMNRALKQRVEGGERN